MENKINEVKEKMNNFEIDPYDYEDQYNDFLDEYILEIGNLTFYGSDIMKRCDPVAYRCGINDYVDEIEKEEDPKYQKLEKELEELEEELEEE